MKCTEWLKSMKNYNEFVSFSIPRLFTSSLNKYWKHVTFEVTFHVLTDFQISFNILKRLSVGTKRHSNFFRNFSLFLFYPIKSLNLLSPTDVSYNIESYLVIFWCFSFTQSLTRTLKNYIHVTTNPWAKGIT